MAQTYDSMPWYRQFWPWFVIALPATAVVAGLATVFIAFKNADSLVDDNYYKDGLAINQQLDQDRAATRMGLSATLRLDRLSGEIFVELAGDLDPPQALQLLLIHPVDKKSDMGLALKQLADGSYRTDIEQLLPQRYYLRLQNPDRTWRLNGEIDFSTDATAQLAHDPLIKSPLNNPPIAND